MPMNPMGYPPQAMQSKQGQRPIAARRQLMGASPAGMVTPQGQLQGRPMNNPMVPNDALQRVQAARMMLGGMQPGMRPGNPQFPGAPTGVMPGMPPSWMEPGRAYIPELSPNMRRPGPRMGYPPTMERGGQNPWMRGAR